MDAKSLIYQFDDVRVDLERFEVAKGINRVHLEPKAFEALIFLIENRGRLVEKKELLDAVWKDAFVTENAMTRVIAQVRKALADDSKEAMYIETVPTRGYRFIAEVEVSGSPETGSVRLGREVSEGPSAVGSEAVTPPGPTPNTGLRIEPVADKTKRKKPVVLVAVALMITAGVGVVYLLSQSTRQSESFAPTQSMKMTRLTHTGKATRAAISPDGKYVAYVKDDAGQQSLWLIQVATASDEQIVPPADLHYYGITFSHDSNFIYYVVVENNSSTGVLYIKPVLGGGGRKLIANVDSRITLSPDGKQVAFVRITPPFREYLLMLANVDGTEERRVALRKAPDLFGWGGESGGPAWSPDGKVIACGSRSFSDGYYGNVVGVRVADGVETPITSQRWYSAVTGGSPTVGHVAWLPNGSGLVVVATEHSGSLAQLWQLSYPSDEARKISNDLSGYDSISLTTDSAALATVRVDRLVNIWLAPSGNASRAKQLTSGAGREDGARGLAWTPDGRIVYRSIAGGTPNIWILAADGGGNKQLSVNAPNNSDPAVSPDGRYVVWVSDRASFFNIWRMDIDGSNYKQITNGRGEWFPQYSPDGNWLVYRAWSPGLSNSLWKTPLEGGEPVRLTDEIGWLPSLSPDGKLIACNYQNESSTKWQIAIIPFEGGQPRFLDSLDPMSARPIHWTPDGGALSYPITRYGVSNLWSQPLDGGPPKQLTDFREDLIFDFAWSRDGKQLALSRGVVNSDVVLMSNFK
jgi:Tol biopolymer transport system component/DNA-binding winged helix-turn-helix (wHTH) protein